MSRDQKLDILRQVMSSQLPAQKALVMLDIPKEHLLSLAAALAMDGPAWFAG